MIAFDDLYIRFKFCYSCVTIMRDILFVDTRHLCRPS